MAKENEVTIDRNELVMKSIIAKLVQAAATRGSVKIPMSNEPLFGIYLDELELNMLLWHFGVKKQT